MLQRSWLVQVWSDKKCMWEHGGGLNWKLEQMSFKFQGEETKKREIWFWRNGISERRKREGVAGFQNFEDKFVFWLYKRLKCWCVFFGTNVTFSLDLETPCGCWLGVSETKYNFSKLWPHTQYTKSQQISKIDCNTLLKREGKKNT